MGALVADAPPPAACPRERGHPGRASPRSYRGATRTRRRGHAGPLGSGTRPRIHTAPLSCTDDGRGQPGERLPELGTRVSRLASALPCPAGRSVPGRGGPVRRRRPRPDGTGALGPCWVRGALGPQGREWSATVTAGNEEPQVAQPPAQAAGTTRTSGSDCGPEGRGFESLTQLPQAAVLVNKAGSHRGSASPITHSTKSNAR
jgi:hypothetical protein